MDWIILTLSLACMDQVRHLYLLIVLYRLPCKIDLRLDRYRYYLSIDNF